MAKFVFFVLPNTGGLHATLKVACDLRRRGHHVLYMGLADSRAFVESHGFDFSACFERHFPLGFYPSQQRAYAGSALARLGHGRALVRHMRGFFEALLAEEGSTFERQLRELAPDLLILASGDHYVQWPGMFAHGLGIPVSYFHDQLWPIATSGLPPIWSHFTPRGGLFDRTRVALAWRSTDLYHRAVSWLARPLGLDPGEAPFLEALARRCRYELPVERPQFDRQHPRAPELVPVPADFDLPHRGLAQRHHVEAGIYLERKQAPFEWQRLRPGHPLLYVALGTVPFFTPERYLRFFQEVVAAARARPELDWVVALGPIVDAAQLGSLPANCHVLREAPQLELLARAALMVTHGGCNSVKECIFSGVPMVVLPLGAGTDQPGNAARVVYHQLGVRRRFTLLDARGLLQAIDQVLGDTRIARQVQHMRARFLALEAQMPAARLLEGLAARRPVA